MTNDEAKAMARKWFLENMMMDTDDVPDALAALILSVDAKAREDCAKVCDELQEDMADADKCASTIRAGSTS